jgi:hypothetical protein
MFRVPENFLDEPPSRSLPDDSDGCFNPQAQGRAGQAGA